MRGLLNMFLLGALMTVAAATSVLARGERSEDQSGIQTRALPKDQSEHATVDRIDPEFREFDDAMNRIASRYEERDRQEAEANERRREPPPAAPGPGPNYGPGFASLSLQEKLAIMQESFQKEWARKELEHKKRMDDYAKELDRKSDRLDKAVAAVPGVLVKAGEPPALVERFRTGWLRPNEFYRRQLAGDIFREQAWGEQGFVLPQRRRLPRV